MQRNKQNTGGGIPGGGIPGGGIMGGAEPSPIGGRGQGGRPIYHQNRYHRHCLVIHVIVFYQNRDHRLCLVIQVFVLFFILKSKIKPKRWSSSYVT